MIEFGCIVSAAGQGERLGSGIPKALVPIAGTPMLLHALRTVAAHPAIRSIAVVAPPGHLDQVRQMTATIDTEIPLVIVAGGAQRSDSVRAGLAALPAGSTGVLVHDAARPFAPYDVFDRVITQVSVDVPAVIPGLPVVDTIKQVDESDTVLATPARANLRAIQTPQGFTRDVLSRALAQPDADATDDAALVERLGLPVQVVAGHPSAFKITTPTDLLIAEDLVARAVDPGARTHGHRE